MIDSDLEKVKGEKKQAINRLIVEARIEELEQIEALGDGLGKLAKHALTIGVHIEDRLSALQQSLTKEEGA